MVKELFERQRANQAAVKRSTAHQRAAKLERLKEAIVAREKQIYDALYADFRKAPLESEISEIVPCLTELKDAIKHLHKWMKPQRVPTPLTLVGTHSAIHYEPRGVVLIIGPWNYPFQLVIAPLIAAIAAGNCVIVKPSELTAQTSRLLKSLLGEVFSEDEVAVVEGDHVITQELLALPFDHFFFTGSTRVGKIVAEAAARHLASTTLELGGKSPCILDASCRIEDAAAKIAHGKLLNAGQTCIAPDYVLLPRAMEGRFVEAFTQAANRLFPRFDGNPDYAALVGDRYAERLDALVADAQAQGARVHAVATPPTDNGTRQMVPRLVLGATADMALMQQEIFGPVLPVIACESTAEAIAFINARPRPLALYWFGDDTAQRDAVLQGTVSGGVTVNDTLMHIAHEGLPFGGVGDSGWGASHGEAGFLRFTHEKAVFVQSKWAGGNLLYPPYGARFDRMMKLLRRLV